VTGETPQRRTRAIKVGLFLAAGLTMILALLLVVGRSQRPFAAKVHLHTAFRNTAGLIVGAPVRLGGVDVGTVEEIRFAPDLAVKEVSVALAVEAQYLTRIRTDSRAMLTAKGLLGDLTVTITVGNASAPPLADGGFVPSSESQSITEMVDALQGGISDVRSLSQGLRGRLDVILTPELGADVGRLVHALADEAEAVQRGPGLAHALIYDPQLAGAARAVAGDARRGAGDLASAMARLDRIAAAVQSGGTLHRLVYQDDLGPMLADAQRATAELAEATAAIRAGHGPLHALVYGREGDELLRNLTALSRTLKTVGDDTAAGKGTLGALLRDPTIYEDLKVILHDVQRNTLLKALVRFTIEHDGLATDAPAAAR
jgi:phospholipid/cholesterol/gamma-HCH transport system substrate-binding protein